jgi:hypothetical protein
MRRIYAWYREIAGDSTLLPYFARPSLCRSTGHDSGPDWTFAVDGDIISFDPETKDHANLMIDTAALREPQPSFPFYGQRK